MADRTHGPTIGFRLPLADHADLEARAAEKGETPGQYVRRNIIQFLAAKRQPAIPVNKIPSPRNAYRRRNP